MGKLATAIAIAAVWMATAHAVSEPLAASVPSVPGNPAESPAGSPAGSPLEALYMSFSMILVSEVGDKTFLIAALMAMKHSRLVVFSASVSALFLMTLLSGLLGEVLPALVSPTTSQLCASILFGVFAVSLFKEGLSMDKNQGVNEEMKEAKEDVEAKARMAARSEACVDLESQRGLSGLTRSTFRRVAASVWMQTFVMTFLSEWGDRSQIATIAMAAGSQYALVVIGGSLGHAVCSLVAVVGGQLIAQKISMRTVVLSGAVTFTVFSGWYLYTGLRAW